MNKNMTIINQNLGLLFLPVYLVSFFKVYPLLLDLYFI